MSVHFTPAAFRANAGRLLNQKKNTRKKVLDDVGFCNQDSDFPETFSLVNKHMGIKDSFRFSKQKSLFLLSYKSPVRRFCIRLICTQWFDHFIISLILINCVLLAADTEAPYIEYAFAVIYTLEVIVKVLARGFAFHEHAYLRDPWNVLDFVVVFFGYLTLVEQLNEFSFIKALKVLRALRTIAVVPGLRVIVNSLLKSLQSLSDIMLLTLFFLAVLAIIGLQVFMGQLRNRCITTPDLVNNTTWSLGNTSRHGEWWGVRPEDVGSLSEEVQAIRMTFINDTRNWIPDAEDPIICGPPNAPGTRQCPERSACLQTDINPNDGYTSFDNFGSAMLTCAQLITLDFWEDVYGKVLGASGEIYILYFLIVVFFGSFYLLNLVLAVVFISYEQEVMAPQKEKACLAQSDSNKEVENYPQQKQESYSYTVTQSFNNDSSDLTSHTTYYVDYNNVGPKRAPKRGFLAALKVCCCKQFLWYKIFGVYPEVEENDPTKETYYEILCDVWAWFRSQIRSFIFSFWFENGVMMCIVLNTICLALDSHNISDEMGDVLSKVNDCLTWIFTTELVIKLVGLLPTEFWKTRWNIFDTIIVVVSLVELNLDTAHFNVSGLRSLRVLRVFRLAKSWNTMKALIDIIAESLSGLMYLSIILGVGIYTLSVIGMNLFKKDYENFFNNEALNPDSYGNMPRWNYQDFYHSFVLVFRILCGEWIELLWETLQATGGQMWPVLFYLGALVLGNFLLLNLFLALLLNAFGTESINKKKETAAEVVEKGASLTAFLKKKLFNITKSKHKLASEIRMSTLDLSALQRMKTPCKHRRNPGNCDSPGNSNNPGNGDNPGNCGNQGNSASSEYSEGSEYMDRIDVDEHEGNDPYSCDDCCQCCSICCRPLCVCCSMFREATRRIVQHKVFDWTILILIMASSVTLAFEDSSLETSPSLKRIVDTLNLFYVVVFTVEMCLKLFTFGVIGYFESAWNWIDSFVVTISIVSTVASNSNIGGLKVIRALRALRPLRAISRWKGMRLSVNALISSIPSFGNVSLVCLVLWLVFCILGVQFFGNTFYKCVGDDGPLDNKSTEIKNKTMCIAQFGKDAWQNSKINFDNTIMAFVALFQVATFEGWMEIMDDAIDSVGIDKQPSFEHNFKAYMFFLVFIFIGSFFTLKLLVGVVIDNFNRLKKEYDEKGQLGVLLTPTQRQWMSTFRKMTTTKPIRMTTRPNNVFMRFCHDLSENQKFEVVITIVILLNMVQMGLKHDAASPKFNKAMMYANYIFTGIYTVEALLKIIGTRKFYFYKSWNIFDFVIVMCAWLGIALDSVAKKFLIDPSILRSLRLFQVARILRVIQVAKGIRRLLYTLVCSLPALLNIGTLLLLIVYIYAVMGVAMFGHVKRQGILNDQMNFERTPAAIILMIRLTTSAGWNDVLDALMVSPPDCSVSTADSPGDCGFKGFAIVYISSFVLIAFLIMINMYIAVILDNFSIYQQDDEVGVDVDDINLFYEKWKVFDPKATGFLNVRKLPDLVRELSQPLGIPGVTEEEVLHLDIPLYPYDRTHCIDVLQALISRTLGPNSNADEFDMIKSLMSENFTTAFPTLSTVIVKTTKVRSRGSATIVLQKAFRRHVSMDILNATTEHFEEVQETEPFEEVQKTTVESFKGMQENETESFVAVQETTIKSFEGVQPTKTESFEEMQETTIESFKGVQENETESFDSEGMQEAEPFEEVQETPIESFEEVQENETESFEEKQENEIETFDGVQDITIKTFEGVQKTEPFEGVQETEPFKGVQEITKFFEGMQKN